ncbi:MAG: TIGR02588 family protein [Coleofasciculaceae cyanobacterium]
MSDQLPEKPHSSSPSIAELVLFSLASFILTIIIGLVIYSWMNGENAPPTLSVTLAPEIRSVDGQFYVPFAVTNTGGITAESVQVVAQLYIEGEVEESGQQEVSFLSGGEIQEGAFIFSRNPQKGKLIVRVASYKLP